MKKADSGQFNDYMNNKSQLQLFIMCYDFLTLFCLNNVGNRQLLSTKQIIEFLFSQLDWKQVRSNVIYLLTILSKFNDKFNSLIEAEQIKQLVHLIEDFYLDME